MRSINEMSGTEKAAALMVALGPDVASEIVRHLDEESIKKIAVEIGKIEALSSGEKEDLIGEFMLDLRKQRGTVYGGENVARDMLISAFGEKKAREVFVNLSRRDLEKGFKFLNDIDSEILVSFLQNEHPQTITVTMAYLPAVKSAEILKSLPLDTARDVAKRLAKMDKTSPEAVLEIARVLRAKYEKHKTSGQGLKSTGGVDTLISILNYLSGDQERDLIDHLEKSVPEIAKEVRERIFVFDLVLNLSNTEIRLLIDEINDDNIISRALKGAGDEMRVKFLRNMSRNRATDIIGDIDSMGPTKLSDIQAARDSIVNAMKKLDDQGSITVRKAKEKYID
jgi:flagellar motor switch protein FliG